MSSLDEGCLSSTVTTDETTNQHEDQDQHVRYSIIRQTTMSRLHPNTLLRSRLLTTKIQVVAPSRLKITMYAALALNEEWSYATRTASPPDPWQVGNSFDVQVAGSVPHEMHYSQLGEPPLDRIPRGFCNILRTGSPSLSSPAYCLHLHP
jgi:hypothetical protein